VLLELMRVGHVDFTSCFRLLSSAVAGDDGASRRLFAEPEAFDAWAVRWRHRLAAEGRATADVVAAMDRTNPVHIPRNHLVEEALAAATTGDLAPYERLLHVVTRPFDTLPGAQRYTEPAPPSAERYRTFCGT
jgi:uncharacterized protein YdiU (UPF0061 family)